MQSNSKQSSLTAKAILAAVLCVGLAATGCTAQWVGVALADLPVLTQMALNIATLVATLQTGKQISAGEVAAVQNISTQAANDLNLLQTLYNQYKANADAGTLQKIQLTIADIDQNLPVLLQQAQVSDPIAAARITAGVNLILTTVGGFAALMPPSVRTARTLPGQKAAIPNASDLKKQWNQQVCSPTGKQAFDAALAGCLLR
jgi:hypothetical protein